MSKKLSAQTPTYLLTGFSNYCHFANSFPVYKNLFLLVTELCSLWSITHQPLCFLRKRVSLYVATLHLPTNGNWVLINTFIESIVCIPVSSADSVWTFINFYFSTGSRPKSYISLWLSSLILINAPSQLFFIFHNDIWKNTSSFFWQGKSNELYWWYSRW